MIGWLNGKLIDKTPPWILLEVNGVGYEIQVPLSTFFNLPNVGQPAVLFIHMSVREDGQYLYGFKAQQEKALFREIIKVSGIGPKIGLAILSNLTVDAFLQNVFDKQIALLTKVPGIGKKTAERLVVELPDRLKSFLTDPQGAVAQFSEPFAQVMDAKTEAIRALESLGYSSKESRLAIEGIDLPGATTESMLKKALQSFDKGQR